MTGIREWLDSLGLGQYAGAFEENAIDFRALPELTEDDLKELGLKLGHRRIIQRAIAELRAAQAPSSAPSALVGSPSPASPSATRGSPAIEPRTAASSATESATPAFPARASPAPIAGEAERRQLTVMFCDLVGSVALGERMDVEDYRDLLARFRDAVVGAVTRYGGFVARHQGDGLLVYFGYPQAHESDAERAVRAGLEAVRAIAHLEHPYDVTPQVRVGIATGPAVVGDVLATGASARSELAALGPTPNLAARLQIEAEPDSVIVSETTRVLIEGLFELDALPARALKGFAEGITPYRVRSELRGQSRFAARSGAHLSPFVGREEELELLTRRWTRVKAGQGQVELVVGEAGIGKSRLVEQLRAHISAEPHELLILQCSPYHETSALYPWIAALERTLGFAETDQARARLDRLARHLEAIGEPGEETLGLIAHLLSIDAGDRFAGIEAMEAPKRRERMLRALVDYVRTRAGAAPVLCAIEDVHWADPSTLELLNRLVEAIESERVLLVVTARPGFDADWTDLPHARVLSLSRLNQREGERLASAVAAAHSALLADALDEILYRAGGNPLFIEELTRAVAQSGDPRSVRPIIPATLRDSLMARLDASEAGKAVAQCASVVGRTVEAELLDAVWEGAPERLAEGLDALERMGLVSRQGEGEFARYAFKHILVRDTAYESLLREPRAALHHRVALALERCHPEMRRNQPALHRGGRRTERDRAVARRGTPRIEPIGQCRDPRAPRGRARAPRFDPRSRRARRARARAPARAGPGAHEHPGLRIARGR